MVVWVLTENKRREDQTQQHKLLGEEKYCQIKESYLGLGTQTPFSPPPSENQCAVWLCDWVAFHQTDWKLAMATIIMQSFIMEIILQLDDEQEVSFLNYNRINSQ